MPNRVAIAYLSHLERPCIEPWLGMFRTTVRHVLWCGMWCVACGKSPLGGKVLTVRWLRKARENRVFAANRRLVQNIGCIRRVFVVFVPMVLTPIGH